MEDAARGLGYLLTRVLPGSVRCARPISARRRNALILV